MPPELGAAGARFPTSGARRPGLPTPSAPGDDRAGGTRGASRDLGPRVAEGGGGRGNCRAQASPLNMIFIFFVQNFSNTTSPSYWEEEGTGSKITPTVGSSPDCLGLIEMLWTQMALHRTHASPSLFRLLPPLTSHTENLYQNKPLSLDRGEPQGKIAGTDILTSQTGERTSCLWNETNNSNNNQTERGVYPEGEDNQ